MLRLDNGNKLFVPSDQQSKDCIVRVLTNIKEYSLSIIPDSRRNGKDGLDGTRKQGARSICVVAVIQHFSNEPFHGRPK
jgi:hypothetical protein